MIEHTGIPVKNFRKSKAFYQRALKPLGYRIRYAFSDACGFMEGGHTSFWVSQSARRVPLHVAFRAKSKKAVHEFYEAALKAGGKDNGAPGYRSEYSPDYYAAFVHDLDGHNIEAVCYSMPKKRQAKRAR